VVKQKLDSRNFVKAYGEMIELKEYRIKWLARVVYSSQFELVIAFIILVFIVVMRSQCRDILMISFLISYY